LGIKETSQAFSQSPASLRFKTPKPKIQNPIKMEAGSKGGRLFPPLVHARRGKLEKGVE